MVQILKFKFGILLVKKNISRSFRSIFNLNSNIIYIYSHYRKALGALLVFDLTRRQTFEVVQRFLIELRQYAEPDCVGYLVGNKTDLIESNPDSRQVQQSEAKAFADENKLTYIETSALSSSSVTEAFESLVEGMNISLYIIDIYQVKLKDPQNTKKEDFTNIRLNQNDLKNTGIGNSNSNDNCSC